MNLEEFIQATLCQIIGGVRGAQEATKLPGRHHSEADLVNPRVMYGADNAPKEKHFARVDRNLVYPISFDVAVTSEQSIEGNGGFSIKVAGMGVKGGLNGAGKDTVVSRIKFEVPVAYPQSSDLAPPV